MKHEFGSDPIYDISMRSVARTVARRVHSRSFCAGASVSSSSSTKDPKLNVKLAPDAKVSDEFIPSQIGFFRTDPDFLDPTIPLKADPIEEWRHCQDQARLKKFNLLF